MIDAVEFLEESSTWKGRKVSYFSGSLEKLLSMIPRFEKNDFVASDNGPPNPRLKTIVRQPLNDVERAVPVGVVSKNYSLIQHHEIINKCLEGIKQTGIDFSHLKYELGMTSLGELMNFRVKFPDNYNFDPGDGHKIGLRLECFNSVEGSSRLTLLLGWFRFICANGVIFGKTKLKFDDIHNKGIDISDVPGMLAEAMKAVEADIGRLRRWATKPVHLQSITKWVDTKLTKKWGKKAACRALHICKTGHDAILVDPFAPGAASEKPVRSGSRVPGAPEHARTLFDVCQALSWIASHRENTEQRISWQSAIPSLVESVLVVRLTYQELFKTPV